VNTVFERDWVLWYRSLIWNTNCPLSLNVMVCMSAVIERCSYVRGMMVLMGNGFLYEVYPLRSFILVICWSSDGIGDMSCDMPVGIRTCLLKCHVCGISVCRDILQQCMGLWSLMWQKVASLTFLNEFTFLVASCYCNLKLNDTGKKDYVRLLASAQALSSYVIRLLV